MAKDALNTTCCVVGGGPAGIMSGYLLARAGVPVIVLEKHADFFRDFRGDTVHPSTMEVLYELDLLDDFLKLPHEKIFSAGGVFGGFKFQGPDFRHVPAHAKFVALMPQWDFLNFLVERAKKLPAFDLRMSYEGLDLIRSGDRIAGVLARAPDGALIEIHADLVLGCDGRNSRMRTGGELELTELGVPIDVLWFRISRRPDDPQQVLGTVNFGKALILLNRGDYFQCGMIIGKGRFDEIKRGRLDAFRASILQLAPYFETRVNELLDWEQVKLLTVQINRLQRWYRTGLLCIGDAAHAMSPAGGVGINLAIQDAVGAANLLAPGLQRGALSNADLALLQKRREFPARATQAVQAALHNGFARIMANEGRVKAPWQLKIAVRIPGIHRVLGYAVGMGMRPEHVAGAERSRAAAGALRAPTPSWLSRLAVVVGSALGSAVAAPGRIAACFKKPLFEYVGPR